MDFKLIRQGVELSINTELEKEITLNIGDKILINEYLKYFEVRYTDGELILIEPDGNTFTINGIDAAFEHNFTQNIPEDFNKLQDIYDANSEDIEEYSYIAFLDDDMLDDNIIDTIEDVFNNLGPATVGQENVQQAVYSPTFAERTGNETNIETTLRDTRLEFVDRKLTALPQDNTRTDLTITEETYPMSFTISEYSGQNMNKVDIPTVTVTQTTEVPTFNEVSVEKTRTTEVEETFTNYRTETETEIIETEMTRTVINETAMSDAGYILVDGQWVKNTVETFIDTRETEETFIDYITEIETYIQTVVEEFENTREVVETFTNYRTEKVEHINNIEVDVNLNQHGEYIGITTGLTSTATLVIKSYKTSTDDGKITFYKNGEAAGSLNIDDIYNGKENAEVSLDLEPGYEFDSFVVEHTGEAKGDGINSQEFKVVGASTIVISQIEVPFEDTRTVTETFTDMRDVDIELERYVEVPFQNTRIVTEEFLNTRDVVEVAEEIITKEETYTEYETIITEIEVPYVDTRIVEVEETYTEYEYETIYETVEETIEMPDPEFDTSSFVRIADEYFEYKDYKVLEILSDDEGVRLDLDSLGISLDNVDTLVVGENINIDLNDFVFDSENDNKLNLIIGDSNDDGAIEKTNVIGTRDNVDIVWDYFNSVSNDLLSAGVN